MANVKKSRLCFLCCTNEDDQNKAWAGGKPKFCSKFHQRTYEWIQKTG